MICLKIKLAEMKTKNTDKIYLQHEINVYKAIICSISLLSKTVHRKSKRHKILEREYTYKHPWFQWTVRTKQVNQQVRWIIMPAIFVSRCSKLYSKNCKMKDIFVMFLKAILWQYICIGRASFIVSGVSKNMPYR